jgi:hypothetical protein
MLRKTCLATLICLVSGPVLRADEEATGWLEFFVGDWTRHREVSVQGEGKQVDSAKWSCHPAAGGAAIMSTGTWANGAKWVMIGASDPGRIYFERGITSPGYEWLVDYTKVDARR